MDKGNQSQNESMLIVYAACDDLVCQDANRSNCDQKITPSPCSFSGVYYLQGEVSEVDDNGNIIEGTTVVYKEKDLINNNTLELSTLAKNKLLRPGVANLAIDNNGESGSDYNVQIEGIEGGVTIIEGNGSYIAQSPTYTFNSGDKPCPEVNLNYTYELAGKRYKVKEQLVLRRDPVNDLRVESWK